MLLEMMSYNIILAPGVLTFWEWTQTHGRLARQAVRLSLVLSPDMAVQLLLRSKAYGTAVSAVSGAVGAHLGLSVGAFVLPAGIESASKRDRAEGRKRQTLIDSVS